MPKPDYDKFVHHRYPSEICFRHPMTYDALPYCNDECDKCVFRGRKSPELIKVMEIVEDET